MAQVSAEKHEHTGPPEKERVASVPQREQLAKAARVAFAKSGKEHSHLSKSLNREMGESK